MNHKKEDAAVELWKMNVDDAGRDFDDRVHRKLQG